MAFSDADISDLILRVKRRMSEKRFAHTLSVMDTALMLADHTVPESRNVVSVAALLHDIAKEIPIDDQIAFLEREGETISEFDLQSKGVIHSYTAPYVVQRDFREYATSEVLSAVRNHTLGDPDMSFVDEIIFLADFIEASRGYKTCIELRQNVVENLSKNNFSENVLLIHSACIEEIDSTLKMLLSEKKFINPKIILTRNALLSKILSN